MWLEHRRPYSLLGSHSPCFHPLPRTPAAGATVIALHLLIQLRFTDPDHPPTSLSSAQGHLWLHPCFALWDILLAYIPLPTPGIKRQPGPSKDPWATQGQASDKVGFPPFSLPRLILRGSHSAPGKEESCHFFSGGHTQLFKLS